MSVPILNWYNQSVLGRVQPRSRGSYSDLIGFVADRPGHVCIRLIQVVLGESPGWRPSVNIEVGLEKTVMWYLENESGEPLLGRAGVGERLGKKL